MAGILVVAEINESGVAPISLELLGAARTLGGTITALVQGGDAEGKTLIAHGADGALTATVSTPTADAWLPALEAAVAQSGADIVLFGQTSAGRDLAPALAFKLGTAAAMDCVALTMANGRLRVTRSAYGGNARAEHTWKNPIQIATVKAKSFDPTEADASRTGSVTAISAAGESRIKVVSIEKAKAEGVKLEDAAIVVSGGRGLGDQSAFKQLEDLAGTLPQAAVGASRAACDMGWYPPSQQVGLTGKTVSPNLYIAIGISGASQHMAGMAGSKNIVAINKDGDANMVKVAKFAVVEDYKKVIPALIEEIKKLG